MTSKEKRKLEARLERLGAEGQTIISRAREEERDVDDDETGKLRELTEEMRSIRGKLGGGADGPGHVYFPDPNDTMPGGFRSRSRTEQKGSVRLEVDGEEVRAFGPDENLADECRDYALVDGIKPDEFSFGRLIAGYVTGDWKGRDAEQRVMEENVGASGGFLVPAPYSLPLLDMARNQAKTIAAGAYTFIIDRPEATMAVVIEDPTAQWLAEHGQVTASDASLAQLRYTLKKLGVLCRPSTELVEDAPNAAQVIQSCEASAIGLGMDLAFLMGDGVGKPLGLYHDTRLQEIAGIGTPTDYSKFSQAWRMIQDQNGPDTGLGCIMAPRTRGTLDNLQDTTNQPLRPPESWGAMRKFSTNQIPVNLGAGSDESCAFVGEFKQYFIAMRSGVVIESARFADSDSTTKFQVVVRSHIRLDGFAVRPTWFVRMLGITA